MEHAIRVGILIYCVWACGGQCVAQDADAMQRAYGHFVLPQKGGDQSSLVLDAPSRGPGVGPLSEPSPGPSVIKPAVTIHVAPFFCAPCNAAKRMDWSAFDVTWETGGAIEGYPEFHWKDPRGVTRILAGAYSPDQVRWAWDKTREGAPAVEERATPPAAAAAAPTPHAEVVRVLAILKPRADETFVDYGCGDARWCIAAAQIYGCKAVGVEIDPERADDARRRVEVLGLRDQVQIITGDATATDVKADVGVAYLYSDVLEQLKPKLEQLNRFASYQHRVAGLAMSQDGDSWMYRKPQVVAQPAQSTRPVAVWAGRTYSYGFRGCGNAGCAMCNSINSQLYGRR